MTIRVIISVLVGVIVGFFTVPLLELSSPWQPPGGVGPSDGAVYAQWVAELPLAAYQMYLAFFMISGVVGGFVTHLIARHEKDKLAWVTGFLLIVMAVGKFMAYNHPEWLTYAICIGYIAAAVLGGKVADALPERFFRR
jgi:hypothetical protein